MKTMKAEKHGLEIERRFFVQNGVHTPWKVDANSTSIQQFYLDAEELDVVDGVLFPKAPREALERMLERAPAVRSLFLDTDSPSGDVTHPSTSRWVLSPIESPARVDASLHGLLRLIGLDPAQASRYHGHSAKRFLLTLAEASPRLDEHDSLELGAFSLSTSQRANLTPGDALLRAHTLQISVLPQRYAGQRAVSALLDRIARTELELHRLADRIAECDPSLEDLEAGFELLSP